MGAVNPCNVHDYDIFVCLWIPNCSIDELLIYFCMYICTPVHVLNIKPICCTCVLLKPPKSVWAIKITCRQCGQMRSHEVNVGPFAL